MKVIIDAQNEPTTQLELRLKSTNLRFVHYTPPSHLQYPANIDSISLVGRENLAVIEFLDSREIDMLITMLERFKRENIGCFERWMQKGV